MMRIKVFKETKNSGYCDFRREAAYSLHLIYKKSGALDLARQVLKDHCALNVLGLYSSTPGRSSGSADYLPDHHYPSLEFFIFISNSVMEDLNFSYSRRCLYL
ncbi:hypothetical protein C5167_014899 [Papaver somniferum]|uniref:Uncharacterized protein n=1 Tax=Papaver somniferum TaxID=3469 RepID=A0A4Y7J6G0_PAPSO|nr:hypothetical protein C5167_014899 [Papaver somniferum]